MWPNVEADDEAEAPSDERIFRRNLLLVGVGHALLLGTFLILGKCQPKVPPPDVVWMDGGAFAAGGGEAGESMEMPAPEPEPEPEVETPVPLPEPDPAPVERPTPSEIVLPEATPPPTPRPITPKPATPKATPKPTPRATPKVTPKVTPKKKPASPKPSASPSKAKGTPAVVKSDKAGAPSTASTAKSGTGTNTGTGQGAGRAGGGSGTGDNALGWYYEMLDDRFTSRWEQPLSIVRSAQGFVTTLKIRIGKDGTILAREIANSSGNVLMDDSVLTAAKKVTAVDPLPAGLGGEFYDININFKLDQGQ